MKKLSTNEWIAVVAGLCVVALFFSLGNPLRIIRHTPAAVEQAGAQQDINVAGTLFEDPQGDPSAEEQSTVMENQLIVEDVKVGKGDEARAGQIITVHYSGRLTNGKVFDSSIGRDPLQFVLGAGQVVEGWDRGIAGMKVGGVRALTIPPALGYGAQQVGPIPANSTLIFEVELLGVQSR